MREAIGASWIMIIVMSFIALFSGYLALSINYSKAFRVKDGIIDRLEKHYGLNRDSMVDITQFINEIGYNSKGSCDMLESGFGIDYVGVNQGMVNYRPFSGRYNYCISKVKAYNPSGQLTAAYYKVVVFFSLSLPLLDNFSQFHVSGETININFPKDDWME